MPFLYSLRNQLPKNVPGTLAKIKSWGIKEIEGGDAYGLPIEDFKKLLAQNGLTMVSVGADFKQLAENPLAAVAQAKKFGAKYIVCYGIPHKEDVFTIAEVKNAVGVFNRAGKVLEENGISLCYHPHGYEFRPYENGTLFDYLTSNTDAQYLILKWMYFGLNIPDKTQ